MRREIPQGAARRTRTNGAEDAQTGRRTQSATPRLLHLTILPPRADLLDHFRRGDTLSRRKREQTSGCGRVALDGTNQNRDAQPPGYSAGAKTGEEIALS